MWIKRFKVSKVKRNNTFKVWDNFLVCYESDLEYTTKSDCQKSIGEIKKEPLIWEGKNGDTFLMNKKQ